MTVQYQSSKGPMSIEAMPTPYMRNALAKLQREGDPSRQAEIVAMSAQLAEREAQEANAPPPAGHNFPPEETPPVVAVAPQGRPYEAVKAHIDDLYTEAKNWLDGSQIATAAQADEVARLLDLMRQAETTADNARKLENEPFDAGKAEVQARYAPLISDTKTAPKGLTVKAISLLKAAQTTWLLKLEEAQQAEAKRLRDIADAELLKAQQALQDAMATTDLEARDKAEELLVEAKTVDRAATRAENTKAHAQGEFKAVGLRDNWVTTVSNRVKALRWAFGRYPVELEVAALILAKAEVAMGTRSIDGFTIMNERRV